MLPTAGFGGSFVNPVSDGGLFAPAAVPAPTPTLASPASGDIATALVNLQAAVDALQGSVQAMSGAAQVTGAGPGGAPAAPAGCGCSAGGGPNVQGPPYAPPMKFPVGAAGAPDAAPPAPPTLSPSDDLRQRIVDIARDELAKGVRENGKDRDDAGNIVKYRSAVTGPGENPDAAEAWCADFASWVLQQAGAPIGKDGAGEDHTVAIIKWAKSAGLWQERATADPKPGDLVLIDWEGGTGVDHAAVVEKVEDGRVFTIGGNEGNAIAPDSYSIDDKRMMGFVTPPGA